MLFSSPIFLFLFLPLTLALYFIGRHYRPGLSKPILIIVSLFFYGYWSPKFLVVLVFSIFLNWAIAGHALRSTNRKAWLYIGIGGNILMLGLFKYANFFSDTASFLGLTEARHWNIALPLAISFFTFHQISYLVDISRGDQHVYSFSDYLLYIIFFPHLVAGPIVRHSEFIYQIENSRSTPIEPKMFAQGLTLFAFGLAKKALLADPLAQIANPLFHQALSGPLTFQDASIATLAFSLQIYFDFSGYTDMALGLSQMLGYRLPPNFNAPYAARSLIDFWRKWHMTLSRYLRDYLYISMGGNRFGYKRQFAALLATMLIGGLWHGANWTFVVWGGLHGLGLIVNHLVRKTNVRIPTVFAWAVTFFFVAICFVVFRAESLNHGINVLAGFLHAPTPAEFTWRAEYFLLLTASGFAVIGSSSQILVEKMTPGSLTGAAAAVLLAISFIAILVSEKAAPFIYFQF